MNTNQLNQSAINTAKLAFDRIQNELTDLLEQVDAVLKDEYQTIEELKEQRLSINEQIMNPYHSYDNDEATPEQQTLHFLAYEKGYVEEPFSEDVQLHQIVPALRGYTQRVEVENEKGSCKYQSLQGDRLHGFLFAVMANAQPELSESFNMVKQAQSDTHQRIQSYKEFRKEVLVKQLAKPHQHSPYQF